MHFRVLSVPRVISRSHGIFFHVRKNLAATVHVPGCSNRIGVNKPLNVYACCCGVVVSDELSFTRDLVSD